MYGLDLFSGIGGLALALERWVRTVAYCEQNKYAQAVLLSRMASGDLDRAPVWDDVRTLRGAMLPKKIDIITGGFPCQDISVAGRGGGLGGERSGLFFEIVRLTEETRAPFVFLENVPAIRTRGLREVVRAFANLRYDCRWTCISAAEVGAPHLRKRWFMLAHAHVADIRDKQQWTKTGRHDVQTQGQDVTRIDGGEQPLANAKSVGFESLRNASYAPLQRQDRTQNTNHRSRQDIMANAERERLEKPGREIAGPANSITNSGWWAIEPGMGRVAHGVSARVDRLKCLGNAVVPLQAKTAFEKLIGK